jgi:hypothetical protein
MEMSVQSLNSDASLGMKPLFNAFPTSHVYLLTVPTADSETKVELPETPLGREDLSASIERRRSDTTMLAKKVVSAVRSSLEKGEQFKQSMTAETGMCG